jgi:antitoxin component YwqK of YwqJK toxin-antitoxin module
MQRIEKELFNDGKMSIETPYVGEKKEGIEITINIKSGKIARKALYKENIEIAEVIYNNEKDYIILMTFYDEENCKIFICYFSDGTICIYDKYIQNNIKDYQIVYDTDGTFLSQLIYHNDKNDNHTKLDSPTDPKNINNKIYEPWYHYNKYVKKLFE